MSDGLKEKTRQQILDILTANPRVEKVVLFGSRAMGTHTPTSDIDLALFGDQLTLDDQAKLETELARLPIAQETDLLRDSTIDEEALKEHIHSHGIEWFPWHEQCIGDIAEVVGGGTPRTSEPSFFGGNIPWLTPKDLSGSHPRRIAGGARFLSEEGLAHSSAKLLPENSVLLTSRAPIGYVAIADCPIATNQGFKSMVVKEGHDHDFLFYWLRANKEVLEQHANGSTFKEISGTSVKALKIELPRSLSEQRAIAHILSTLDEKIELNRRMSETLEAMARALFKSWFVDFDPVHAKAEGRDPGLPKPIADLFPVRFVDSELGDIPEGWEVKCIEEAVTCVGGSTPSTHRPEYWEGGTNHWTTPKDLSRLSNSVLIDTERKITAAGLERISSGLLPAGTLLLSSRAPIGYLAIAQVPVAVNQGYIAIPPGGDLSPLWMLFWAENNMERIKGHAGGTTFQEISKRNFRPLRLIVPTSRAARACDELVDPLFKRIVASERQSCTLAALRDALLPKLISGEVRVGTAQLEDRKRVQA